MIENKVQKIFNASRFLGDPYTILNRYEKKIIIINMFKVIEDHGEFHQKTGIYKRESNGNSTSEKNN